MNTGHRLAAAAVAVALPLLALASLEAHRQPVGPLFVAVCLWASAIGFALAVTGGAVYVQWHLPNLGAGRPLVVLGWCVAVVGEAGVLAPWIVLHLRASALGPVLAEFGGWAPWSWAVLWTMIPHVTSATVVRVLALRAGQDAAHEAEMRSGEAELLTQRDEARAQRDALRARIGADGEGAGGQRRPLFEPRVCPRCRRSITSQPSEAAHARYCDRWAAQRAAQFERIETASAADAAEVPA